MREKVIKKTVVTNTIKIARVTPEDGKILAVELDPITVTTFKPVNEEEAKNIVKKMFKNDAVFVLAITTEMHTFCMSLEDFVKKAEKLN